MNAVVSAFLLTFAALFPIVNPIEGAPFFLGLTAGLSGEERRGLARTVAVNGFVLLLGSMVLGPWMLEVFGIELPVVRIAGGLVVAALGWKVLSQEQWSLLAEHATGALVGVVAIGISIYLAYRFADNIGRLLGETGLEVLVRLSAFFLMCIGIEIMWNGYSTLTAPH